MRRAIAAILLLGMLPGAWAAGDGAKGAPSPRGKAGLATPAPVVTRHAVTVDGRRLAYAATTGYLPLTDQAGKAKAEIFFVAYALEGGEPARRPVAFAFNGGPGASSLWLHLGGIGPRRVPLAAAGTELPRVDRLTDNPATWLAFTDLVFVDPVGTGFSRAAPGVDAKQFYAVDRDIEAAAQFIRLYVTKYERWLSPKLVIGESYGTTRAAGLAAELPRAAGLDLAGVVLLSSALNFGAFMPEAGNDLPYPLALPTFTAVAAYHHRLAGPAPDAGEVERWAMTGYTAALAQGDRLPAADRDRTLDRLAAWTGLPRDHLARNHLRVSTVEFAKTLLQAEDRLVGLLDGRVTGVDLAPPMPFPTYDPSLFVTTGPYVAVFNDYLRRELGFETTRPYEYLSRQVNATWQYASAGQGYLYVADKLAAAMSKDARLRVFAAAGRYDLTTPYLSQLYTFDHMQLHPTVRRRLTFHVYESGHQIYTDEAALGQLTADVRAFMAAVTPTAVSLAMHRARLASSPPAASLP